MITHPLPPQAYTKETLTQAFAWLQTQGPAIRELATTPDVLVSLYQKAKLNGEASLWPSVQNFKSELKSLAGMMGEFENSQSFGMSSSETTPPQVMTYTPPQQNSLQGASVQSTTQSPAPSINQTSKSVAPSLDAKSWGILLEVKNEFNLSSEQEALRMLISLGYKKIKSL